MANFIRYTLLSLAALAGAKTAIMSGDKSSDEIMTLKRVTQVEVIAASDKIEYFNAVVTEEIPPSDHLEATVYLSNKILECREQRTSSKNAFDFYDTLSKYLRDQQVSVMQNPNSREEVKKVVEAAEDWYVKNADLPSGNFVAGFIGACPEVSRYTETQKG